VVGARDSLGLSIGDDRVAVVKCIYAVEALPIPGPTLSAV